MPEAPLPPDEQARQAALDRCRVLDGLPQEVLDDFTRRAADAFDAPMAAVSLVDRDRQWFASSVGLDVSETARSCAICAYTILVDSPLYIEDTQEDPGTRDNPLVTGPMGLRFYAGVPITWVHGERIGALCVLDTRPHRVTPEQMACLDALGCGLNHAIAERYRSHGGNRLLDVLANDAHAA
ncbi:MAG: GAF domain-containing protein [Planctomycetota bacterium]